MIEISHLSKKYGDYLAVDDLSLTFEPGRIYGFLGPNGAGKSTTMNMITGYLGFSDGSISINGSDILDQPEQAKKCIGYLPETPPLYTEMTVKEYLDFVAELKKVVKSDRRRSIEDIMEMTKISDVQGRLIRNLSKGYRQRVGFAQAMIGNPDIIILDEPTVGLDPKQIMEVRDLIRQLGKEHTVILSSHILSEVREVCDYIYIISKGKLVASDTTENLLNKVEKNGRKVEVHISGDLDKACELCKELEEVETVELISSLDGTHQLVVTASAEIDIRNKVILTLAGNQIPVLEMKAFGKSLEDIFLELTTQKGEAEL